MEDFKLSSSFLEQYQNKQPEWGPLGYITYKRTYARTQADGTTEEFVDTCKRVVEGVYTAQKKHAKQLRLPWSNEKAQRSAQEMFRRMWDFKFLPPGRGLWMMGTEYAEKNGAALNNPLHEDTRVLTDAGWRRLGDLEGQEVTLLSSTKKYGRDNSTSSSPTWVKATVSSIEVQPSIQITLEHYNGTQFSIVASENHRWFRRTTTNHPWERVSGLDLREGDYLPIVRPAKNYTLSIFGAQHGLFFGDGTRSNGELHQFGDSVAVLKDLFGPLASPVTHRRDDEYVVRNCPRHWSTPPSTAMDDGYIYGFLAGYFAADGTVSASGQLRLSSSRKEELYSVCSLFEHIGVRTTPIRLSSSSSNYSESRELWETSIYKYDVDDRFFLKDEHKNRWVSAQSSRRSRDYAKVVSITSVGNQRVLCASVPEYEQFVTEGFVLTSNCGFVSTRTLRDDFADPFCWLMDMLMLGVGVGFDTKGAGSMKILDPRITPDTFYVEDSREGWVALLHRVLTAYSGKGSIPTTIDYSKVRPFGEPIKGFGGTASGPGPLQDLIAGVHSVLSPLIGKPVTSEAIVDLANLVGRCVVAGNVRRSAEIAFGDPYDASFLSLKNPEVAGDKLFNHRWASNNSIFADVGMDYSKVAEMTAINGEPGYMWLENAQMYSRMGREPDYKDKRALGGNPCQRASATLLTPAGIRTLGELGVGDTVWSGSQWTKITAKWCTGVKPVYKYVTRAGIFEGTENHRIVSNGTKVEVKDAENIDIAWNTDDFVVSINPQDVLDGLVLGDGTWQNSCNDRVCLCIGKDDSDYFSSEVAGLIGKCVSGPYLYAADTTLSRSDLTYTYDRKVPDKFFYGDPSKVCGFLRGLYSANGSIVGGKRISLKSSSLTLVEQVQQMLSSVGIRSYYTVNRPTNVTFDNGEYTCKQSYDLNITVDRVKFYNRIGFIQQYKMDKLKNVIDSVNTSKYAHSTAKASYDIVDIAYLGDYEVFDITVEADEHTYWTGGLLVSNCLEQTLEDHELCCLVETFPSRHDSYEDFEVTLKYAYLYAKSVTLVPTHSERSNAVLMRNRRIGCSMSGIVPAMKRHGRREFFNWCDQGYNYLEKLDDLYSEWLCVPRSIKKTSVKPSGTVSLLPGVTPGIHFPHSQYYIRRIRFQADSPLVSILKDHGYHVEPDSYSPNTVVASFPIKEEYFDRSKDDVTMWEQLELAAKLQTYWADNQVSVTVTFKKEEAKDIKYALEMYEDRLKGVSFLPLSEHGYVQAPYESIDEATYSAMAYNCRPITTISKSKNEVRELYCDGETCVIK